MKKLLLLSFLSLFFCSTKVDASPRASFKKIWIDYDVTENSVKGMRIHLSFSTYEMKEMDAYVAIYFFYDDEWGGDLKDNNKKYYSTAGNVALYKSIKPSYESTDYNNLEIFMPYEELDLSPGTYNLGMDVKVIYKAGGEISKLTTYKFKYTEPSSTTKATESSSKADATIEDMWVDYDVYESGKYGMRIHVKCTLNNLKDVDTYLAIYFEKKNGDKLYTNNTDYRSKSGQIACFKSLKPAYTASVYKDLMIFMPYDELNLPKGTYELTMDADIIYKNGDLVKHLRYKDFKYTK